MKRWKDDYEVGNESDWLETPEYDSRHRRLKKSRKKRKNNRDSFDSQTPRIRSTWE
jgi:hypothetical protein